MQESTEPKKPIDYSNPDLDEVSQIFHTMFGDSFPQEEKILPEGCVFCRPCEGTGRIIKIRKFLLGTSKTVTKTPCPHCGGKGYVPEA
ncbi:MAG: hypothetical protein HFF05_04780 [Oscillospiraceae bacterium]|nr:hypothetical protein [Oscillospiraceae bacterium]